MKDVAASAGVSTMTVSRVVNGEPGVLPETAAKVEQAIRRLGYQRDDVARQLRRKGQLTQTIGLLVDNVADPFMAAFASAAEDIARQHGCVVLIARPATTSNASVRSSRPSPPAGSTGSSSSRSAAATASCVPRWPPEPRSSAPTGPPPDSTSTPSSWTTRPRPNAPSAI